MIIEVGEIAYGRRPGVPVTYRNCQSCAQHRATHYVKHRRKWYQLQSRTDFVCAACLPRTPPVEFGAVSYTL
jgi:hypothetical protein